MIKNINDVLKVVAGYAYGLKTKNLTIKVTPDVARQLGVGSTDVTIVYNDSVGISAKRLDLGDGDADIKAYIARGLYNYKGINFTAVRNPYNDRIQVLRTVPSPVFYQ